ncbi:MAG TPA: hypothetical protein VGU66_16210 [Candidatus Elarobacter sp.]|nr:hypothetical protein [Candidatus Elarobacter sp.]
MIIAIFWAASLIGPGGFLLYQRQTGARAQATVDDCVVSGAGRWRTVNCSGSWIVGGSLFEGGHVIVGTIQGVDESSIGKTIEVTLRGDEAYSRELTLPLLLIGFGLVPAAAAVFILRASRGRRPANNPPLPG